MQWGSGLFTVAVALVGVLVLVDFSYNAHAVTVITVDDEASCEALPLSGGIATWDSQLTMCSIPKEATLQIGMGEVLDVRVVISSAGTINILQGGTIEIATNTELRNHGRMIVAGDLGVGGAELNNFGNIDSVSGGSMSFHSDGLVNNVGTISIRAGVALGMTDSFFYNSPLGILDNYGEITGSSEQSHISNDGTINNHASGRMSILAEMVLTNEPLGVINNFGVIINDPAGVIKNSGKFSNTGVIDNQGILSNHCGGTFTNSGTFTGNPVEDADKPPLVFITSLVNIEPSEDSSSAATIRIQGSADENEDGCGLEKIEIKVKDPITFELFKNYELATPAETDDWFEWSHEITLDQERDYAIVARATDKGGNQNWFWSTFRVDFDAEADQTRPVVGITSPVTSPGNIFTITGPASGVTLNLEGTTFDAGRGVARVEVKLNDPVTLQLLTEYKPATGTGPQGEDDFSTWAKKLTFDEEGTYRITARATDEAGNQNWWHIFAKVEFIDENL